MSSLLDAAKSISMEIKITPELPTKVGSVSIMSITDLYNALNTTKNPNPNDRWSNDCDYEITDLEDHFDPVSSYEGSKYNVYSVVDYSYPHSTAEYLEGLVRSLSLQNMYELFGGPLCKVYGSIKESNNRTYYGFYWWFESDGIAYSDDENYWAAALGDDVYVVVVCAHE